MIKLAPIRDACFTDRERAVLRLLQLKRSAASIGEELGVTRQRAHALIKSAKTKLAALREVHIRGMAGRDFADTEDELLAA